MNSSSAIPASPPRGMQARYTWWEIFGVSATLVLFFVLGRNGINHHVYIGQDFNLHYDATHEMAGNADHWFFLDFTSRPLIYWLGVAGTIFGQPNEEIRFAASVCLIFGVAGLWVAYDSFRSSIHSLPLRLAALALIAFLPITVITTEVYAADTVTILPFALVCWGLVRLIESANRRDGVFAATSLGIGLAVGQFSKFSFFAVPMSVMLTLLLARRLRLIKRRTFRCAALGTCVLPLVIGGWLYRSSQKELAGEPVRHTYNWQGTGQITWRNLLWPKVSDTRIFRAPVYWDTEKVGGRDVQPLIANNGYSYPALLHLGIFSDVLGLTYRNTPASGGARSPGKQAATAWSVRTGVAFSIGIALCVVAFIFRSVRDTVRGQTELRSAWWGWGALSLAWFLPVVLALPYVNHVYDWGYWLPRLILPAIWGFAVVSFCCLDELIAGGRHRWIAWTVLALTLAQCALNFRAVWVSDS